MKKVDWRRGVAGMASALVLLCVGCGGSGGEAPEVVRQPYRFVNPLAQVQEGEWAAYRIMGGGVMHLKVLSVHPLTRVVTLRQQRRDSKNDRVTSSEVNLLGPNHFLWGFEGAGAIIRGIYPDEIEVAGRTWRCLCVETVGNKMGLVRHWYSQEVPAHGLLRQERVGGGADRLNAELLAWGTPKAPEED